jgi:dCMP deaminase
MTRPNIDSYFISIAALVATRSTCLRRSVGCVLVDKRKHVLSTGYNGVASGLPHCNDSFYEDNKGILHKESIIGEQMMVHPHACEGHNAASGSDLSKCQAIHAEQNALLQCRDIWEIETCYVTTAPCVTCTKLLMGTSCEMIVFANPYAHDEESKKLWVQKNGIWLQHSRQ